MAEAEKALGRVLSDNDLRVLFGIYDHMGLPADVILLLLNPKWLPISAEARATMKDLTLGHFLIERSTRITLGHVLTLILAVSVLVLIYNLAKVIMAAVARRSDRA